MPARIIVHLEAASSPVPVPPPQTGPAVNAAFLSALRDAADGDLSATLHDARPPKPYALTPLLDERDQRVGVSSRQVRFEIGVLIDSFTDAILLALGTTGRMQVARCSYKVVAVEMIGAASYEELNTNARPVDRWNLRIITPVAFFTGRADGARRVRPFPEPEWVFTDLHRKWSAFAPDVALDAQAEQTITTNLEVVDYRLTMAQHLIKANVPAAHGSVGQIVYRVVDTRRSTPESRAALDALVCFSTYAGIGHRTAVGMGFISPRHGDRRREKMHRCHPPCGPGREGPAAR